MQLKLGEKIRELRRRRGVTQEELADALGISPQAVSRWETSGAYPDMEMIPPVANFFGITIDELFGYDCERERKIDEIIARADALGVMGLSQSDARLESAIDESIAILRGGVAEFPGNERLTYRLACALKDAGYRRSGEEWDYDADGFLCHIPRRNEYWDEALKLYETLAKDSRNFDTACGSLVGLVNLYSCVGDGEHALAAAKKLPPFDMSREAWEAYAASGAERARAEGRAVTALLRELSEHLIQDIISQKQLYETDVPAGKIKGLLKVYDLIFDDGNFGRHHMYVSWLYLYLARIQWERGQHDEAFASLDMALSHADAFDDACEHGFGLTAPLVRGVDSDIKSERPPVPSRRYLPDDFPAWANPDSEEIKREISADPRWTAWVEKTER